MKMGDNWLHKWVGNPAFHIKSRGMSRVSAKMVSTSHHWPNIGWHFLHLLTFPAVYVWFEGKVSISFNCTGIGLNCIGIVSELASIISYHISIGLNCIGIVSALANVNFLSCRTSQAYSFGQTSFLRKNVISKMLLNIPFGSTRTLAAMLRGITRLAKYNLQHTYHQYLYVRRF